MTLSDPESGFRPKNGFVNRQLTDFKLSIGGLQPGKTVH